MADRFMMPLDLKPAPLDLTKLQDDLAKLATSPAPASPIRYILKTQGTGSARKYTTRNPPTTATQSTAETTTTTTTTSRLFADPGNISLALHLPAIVITDILRHTPRDRAVHWLSRALVRNESYMVFQEEIYTYYRLTFSPHFSTEPGQGILEPGELMELVLKIFKGVRADSIPGRSRNEEMDWVMRNMAWRGQPTDLPRTDAEQWLVSLKACTVVAAAKGGGAESSAPSSVTTHAASAIPPTAVACNAALLPEDDHTPYVLYMTSADIHSGRRLVHLPEPARTKCWLRMFFERGDNVEVDEASMRVFYLKTFNLSSSSPNLDAGQFIEQIPRVFRGVEDVEVGPECHVLWGLKARAPRGKASDVLKHHAKRERDRTIRQLERMHAGDDLSLRIEPHRHLNKFQELLLSDPLLSLQADQPSPWLQRLQRRAKGEPLGDHQVGFPGVSMRRVERELRRDCEELRKVVATKTNLTKGAEEKGRMPDGALNHLVNAGVDDVVHHESRRNQQVRQT